MGIEIGLALWLCLKGSST